jgi:hypothetical protein
MAHREYYLACRSVMETIRSSHVKLIEHLCDELGAPDRRKEFELKFIDDSIRIKKFKDKNHPKRPKSGYMLYCEKYRSAVKDSLPEDASFSDIIKKMAKDWGKLSDTKKTEFTQLAEDDKLRYSREVEAYEATLFKLNVGGSA